MAKILKAAQKENLTKQEKPAYHLLVPQFTTAIAKVLTNGAKKYAPHNWEKGLPWSEVYRALQGHLTDWYEGKEKDHEWQFSHLAHAGCCLMFLFFYAVVLPSKYKKFDDRTFKVVNEEEIESK